MQKIVLKNMHQVRNKLISEYVLMPSRSSILVHVYGAMLEFVKNFYLEEVLRGNLVCTGRCDGLILRMAEELKPHPFWTHEPTDGRERKNCTH